MEKEKESVADIYECLQPHKKVSNWASLVPVRVTVRDDVARKRFALTSLKGKTETVLVVNKKKELLIHKYL